MADVRLIFREQLQYQAKDKTKLSYEELFEEKPTEDVDYQDVIERNNLEWTRRLNETRQLAIKEGYQAGFSDGEAKARQRIDEQLNHFENALMELDQRLRNTIEEIKPGVTSLVFDMAEKVIGVPVENEQLQLWVQESVKKTLDSISENTKIEILVSEYDYESIVTLMEKTPGIDKIKVNYSKTFKPGEFKIESSHDVTVNNFSKKMADLRKSIPLQDWGNT
jgi:flagellar biosynthesis/type III secretory pathway protein FliH